LATNDMSGEVTQILGSVVDIRFPPEAVPETYYAVEIPTEGHAPLVVEVTARQFVWQFEYPASGISSPELHVPAGSPVQLELVAQDVIHSLWVPAFRLKQDALPHTSTFLSFTATTPGEFPIVCAELCGPGHAVMRSRVVVHEPEDFARWLEEQD